MIINADCDRVFQAQAGGGAMQTPGGIGGMNPVGGMNSIGGTMPGGTGAGMAMPGSAMGGGAMDVGQARQQLQTDLKSAQSQGWKPGNPQVKMKIESALGHPMNQQGGVQPGGGLPGGGTVPATGGG